MLAVDGMLSRLSRRYPARRNLSGGHFICLWKLAQKKTLMSTDIAAAQLRQRYVPILRRVLPAKKAATFFQLGQRISMMIDVELTSRLPLMQSQE